MPTYTYRCKECDYEFDQRQSFSDDPLTVCPNCAADNGLRKVVNSVGIVFKGSGFYVTDNANGKGKVSVPSDSSENGKSANSSEPKPAKTETESQSSTPSAKTDGQSSSSEKSSTSKEKSAA